jgi:Flp pilus assembly protein TadG
MRISIKRSLYRFVKEDQGSQLAELAIVLPIMLVLFAATAEFGRFYYEYSTLAKGTRLGARYLTSVSVSPAEDTAAKNLVVYGNTAGTGSPIVSGLSTDNVVITRAGGLPVLPATVNVKITNFKHQPIFDIGKLINSSTFTMSLDVKPSTTMRFLLTEPAV